MAQHSGFDMVCFGTVALVTCHDGFMQTNEKGSKK